MSIFPDRLVTAWGYTTQESAEEDKAKLASAGLTAYLVSSHESGSIELRVPEAELQRAIEVLGIHPEEAPIAPPDSEVPRCPECASDHSRKLPPYAGYVFLASSVLGILFFALGFPPAAVVAVFVGWLTAMWLSRYSGHSRCAACGHLFKN